MSEKINHHRRRFLGTAAVTIAAAQLGMIGCAKAQSSGMRPGDLPTIKPGTNTSFGPLKQIDVRPSPNGITFFADYKNWETISSTDRVDLGQTRVILGNDVAVKAIADKHTNPWPDGSAFAKLAWAQVADADGSLHTGEFKTAAFMIKGAKKYASTDGWGFARWHGEQLEPYGHDASFATECVDCHAPMAKYDFVFTTPIDVEMSQPSPPDTVNDAASLAKTSFLQPHTWRVITSWSDRRNGTMSTMSTLYGDPAAVASARSGAVYPAGARLSLVTWKREPDERWFEAYIPGAVQSVEEVQFPTAPGARAPTYSKYEGQSVRKSAPDPEQAARRTAYIVSQRAAILP